MSLKKLVLKSRYMKHRENEPKKVSDTNFGSCLFAMFTIIYEKGATITIAALFGIGLNLMPDLLHLRTSCNCLLIIRLASFL